MGEETKISNLQRSTHWYLWYLHHSSLHCNHWLVSELEEEICCYQQEEAWVWGMPQLWAPCHIPVNCHSSRLPVLGVVFTDDTISVQTHYIVFEKKLQNLPGGFWPVTTWCKNTESINLHKKLTDLKICCILQDQNYMTTHSTHSASKSAIKLYVASFLCPF